MPQSVAVRLRLSGRRSSAFHAFIAAVLFCGVAFAIGLSAAPQLHDWLHKDNGAQHQCAATLISTGGWDHAHSAPCVSGPPPLGLTLPAFVHAQPIRARAQASILEHAPPAES